MRLTLLILLVISLLLTLPTVFVTKSVPTEETTDNLVDASFNIEITSATEFNISVELDVSKITLTGTGTSYTRGQIEALSADNPYVLGAIEHEINILLFNTLLNIFKGAIVKTSSVLPTYENNKFYEKYTVNLTNSFFGLNETINPYEYINGLLNMGGIITYTFDLQAEPGWNNTYIFNLNNKYSLTRTNGKYDITENTIQWDVKNWNGNKQNTTAELSMKDKNPTTTETKQDIFLEFLLNSENKTTNLQINILIKKMDITNYSVIPSFISNLTKVTADGIRLLIKNNLTTWEEIYQKTIQPTQEKIKTTLETNKFNQTLDLVFNWDNNTTTNISEPYNVKHMDEKPPVTAMLKDDEINLKIYDIPVRGLFGLINSGAQASVTKNDINFGDKIENIGYPYNITLLMPKDITLNNQNRFTWNTTTNFTGEFQSKNPKTYNNEKIDTTIEIDIKKTDLNLVNIFTGKTELSFGLDISQKNNYSITRMRDEFRLPDEIKIQFLNSDALRLCIEEEIFTEDMVNSFLTNEKNEFEKRLKTVIPGLKIKGNIDKQTFENSLKWDEDINQMDSNTPVTTSSYSYTTHPIVFDLSLMPPGFKIHNQTYRFEGIKNQSVTYKIIFPKGITVDAYDEHNKTKVKETTEGRYYLEISFSPSESDLIVNTTCIMTPSVLFTIGILTPCFVTLFIILILIIVIIMLRRKRGRIKPVKKREETPPEIANEEYYIPPPGHGGG